MNIFSINRYIGAILAIVLYAFGILCWVFVDEGFNGLKFLSVYALFASLLFGWWVGHVYVISIEEERKTYKKSQIGIGFFLLIIMSMSFGLNQKIAILFFDVDKHASQLKEAKVIMEGGVKAKLNRFSGTGEFPVMKVVGSDKDGIPICNLLLTNGCEYGYKKGQSFNIKFVNGLGYPFKYRTIIFEMKSGSFYQNKNYYIDLYKRNKKYVVLYLILILLASILIIFSILCSAAFIKAG